LEGFSDVVQAGKDEIGGRGKWQWFGAFVVKALLDSGSQAGGI
jgi:hypothetical protein